MSSISEKQQAFNDAQVMLQFLQNPGQCIQHLTNNKSLFGPDFAQACNSLKATTDLKELQQQADKLLVAARQILEGKKEEEKKSLAKPMDVTSLTAASSSATASVQSVASTSLIASSPMSGMQVHGIPEKIVISNTLNDNLLNQLQEATEENIDALWGKIKEKLSDFSDDDRAEIADVLTNLNRAAYTTELFNAPPALQDPDEVE